MWPAQINYELLGFSSARPETLGTQDLIHVEFFFFPHSDYRKA